MINKVWNTMIRLTLTTLVALAILSGVMMSLTGCGGESDKPAIEKKTTLYTCGMHPWVISKEPGNCPICGMKLTPKKDETGTSETKKERKILYWRAPMNPLEIYDKPGKSAMGMDLVPVYDDELSGGVEINIDPVTQQNMGVRTAMVEKGPLVHTIRTYGHITYDETRTAEVSPRFNGWVEKLHVDFTGQPVEKGEPLFDIYSPDLLTAQEEYLVAYRNLKSSGRMNTAMLESARRRLRFFNVADKEIHAIETSNAAMKALTIRSSYNGIVTAKEAVEGSYVKAGTMVYKIADLSRVWVEAHIYEYELDKVSIGQDAWMTLPYLPGKTYAGKVAFVYPYLQRKTRDVVIRLEFENPDMKLKPDMYADVHIKTQEQGEGLTVPSEAVIRSGERNIVFVTRGDGKFTPREVTLGISVDDGKIHVLTGLAAGETVVTSGQFLLDSESKLKEATLKMLEPEPEKPEPAPHVAHSDTDFFNDME